MLMNIYYTRLLFTFFFSKWKAIKSYFKCWTSVVGKHWCIFLTDKFIIYKFTWNKSTNLRGNWIIMVNFRTITRNYIEFNMKISSLICGLTWMVHEPVQILSANDYRFPDPLVDNSSPLPIISGSCSHRIE